MVQSTKEVSCKECLQQNFHRNFSKKFYILRFLGRRTRFPTLSGKKVRVQMQLNFKVHPRYFYFSLYRGVAWTFSKTPIKFSVCNNQPKLSKTISISCIIHIMLSKISNLQIINTATRSFYTLFFHGFKRTKLVSLLKSKKTLLKLTQFGTCNTYYFISQSCLSSQNFKTQT